MATALAPGVTSSSTAITATTSDPDRPDQTTAWYERLIARAKKCRDLMIGTEAIRDGEEDYLPRFDEEDDDSYAFRLGLAALSNGFARTVLASVGLLLQQPPVLGDDMPETLKALAENVDGAGTHLNIFAWNMILAGIIDGRAGVLADYQRVENPERTSLADEKTLGLRPYFVLYESPDIYVTHYETINGVRVLTLLVLRETVEVRVGRFGVAPVTRFRIYSRVGPRVTYEVWESSPGDSSGTIAQTVRETSMRNVTEIPFHCFQAGQLVGTELKPPLMDLADLVLEHHRIKSGILYLEQVAFIPSQVRIGADADKDGNYPPIVRGPRSVIEAPRVDGVAKPVYWDGPDISVIEPAMKTLENNEQAQGAAGLAFLSPDTRAAETAKAKQIDAASQNATLATVGMRAQDTIEAAFGFAGQFIRETAGSVTINTDFEQTAMDAQMVSALGTLATNGKLDLETLLDLLEEGRILPDGVDKAGIIRRILTENAPTEPAPGADPLPDGTPPGQRSVTVKKNADGTHTLTTGT